MNEIITTGNIFWVIFNLFWSVFLIIFNNRHQQSIRKENKQNDEKDAIEKEQKEFERLRKKIPEKVINVVKKGLDKNSLATELLFASILKKEGFKGPNVIDEYIIRFGEYSEQISKELYDKEGDIENFLVNNDFSKPTTCGTFGRTPMILNQDFLSKIDKWVKSK